VGFLGTALAATGTLGATTLGYSLIEAQAFTTREHDLAVLKSGSTDLRVLHLSDLHLTPAQTRKIAWLQSLEALEPDLVVVTGDMLSHQFAVPAVAEALGSLLNRPGMFVLGSNDYFSPAHKNPLRYLTRKRTIVNTSTKLPTQDLIDMLCGHGWLDLNNKQDVMSVNGVKIHARGTNDPHIKLDDYAAVAGPYEADAFALGVTHAPYLRVLEQFNRDNTELLLAGHTHGGQICIPFYGALVTNCDLPTGQAKGISEFTSDGHSMPLHVSAGVGTNPYTPIRLACRPEATLLTLKSR
jgi:predicted MPP superfamily phosphohydrolase